MRMKKLYLIAALLCVSCTTAADVQQQCNAATQNFVDEVSCIEGQVGADPYLGGDSFVQEYVLSGRVLADRVRAGRLTENEARLQFARDYNQLLLQQSRRDAYDAMAWERLRPRDTDCRIHGDQVSCTSY
jgi:hypothetical protein